MTSVILCSVSNCDKAAYKRGMCNTHYIRNRRYGDVNANYRHRRRTAEFLENVAAPYTGDDCITWPFHKMTSGYSGLVTTPTGLMASSQYVCQLVNGPKPSPKHEVAHSCGNGLKGCINGRHLSWKTHQENIDDKRIHGTNPRGMQVKSSKLTDDDVRHIRSLAGKIYRRDLAALFNVHQDTIGRIVRKETWAHIE